MVTGVPELEGPRVKPHIMSVPELLRWDIRGYHWPIQRNLTSKGLFNPHGRFHSFSSNSHPPSFGHWYGFRRPIGPVLVFSQCQLRLANSGECRHCQKIPESMWVIHIIARSATFSHHDQLVPVGKESNSPPYNRALFPHWHIGMFCPSGSVLHLLTRFPVSGNCNTRESTINALTIDWLFSPEFAPL